MASATRSFSRSDRVAEQIQRNLSELFRRSLKDPRAGWVTITLVHVTRDYSHARVFYTVMETHKRDSTQQALESASGYLRSELSRSIRLFVIPRLHFIYDESVERGIHVTGLISQVVCAENEEFRTQKSILSEGSIEGEE
jgi:ribosome-binding factor A